MFKTTRMPGKSRHAHREKDQSSRTLKVNGLSHHSSETDVEELFEKYGRIRDVFIPKDKFSKESSGYAHIRYYHKRDADRAYKAVRNKKFDGRKLEIERASRPSGRNRSRSRERSRPRRDREKSPKGRRRMSPNQSRMSQSEGNQNRRSSSKEKQMRLDQRKHLRKRQSRSSEKRQLPERNLPPKVWDSPHIHTCFRCRKPYRHFHRFRYPYHKQHSGQCPNRSCDAYHNGFNERYAEPVSGNEVREWEKKYGQSGKNKLTYM